MGGVSNGGSASSSRLQHNESGTVPLTCVFRGGGMEREARMTEAALGSLGLECQLDNFRFPWKGRGMCDGATLKREVWRQLLRANAGFARGEDMRGD